MEDAFSAGYDPALELVTHSARMRHLGVQDLELEVEDSELWTEHLRRKEQDVIDLIVGGEETGHYFVLLGAKVASCPSPICGWNISTFTLGYG